MNIEKPIATQALQRILYKSKDSDPINPSSQTLKSDKEIIDDIVSISGEAKELLAKDKNSISINEDLHEFEEMLNQLRESTNSPNPYMNHIKCIQIAMRIMNGDEVPSKDKAFLLENEPKMYSQAILLRQKNDHPKRHASLLEDEEDDVAIAESSDISFENSSEESISIDDMAPQSQDEK